MDLLPLPSRMVYRNNPLQLLHYEDLSVTPDHNMEMWSTGKIGRGPIDVLVRK